MAAMDKRKPALWRSMFERRDWLSSVADLKYPVFAGSVGSIVGQKVSKHDQKHSD